MYINEINLKKKRRMEDRINKIREEQESLRKTEESILIERKNHLEKKVKLNNQFWDDYHNKQIKDKSLLRNQNPNILSHSLNYLSRNKENHNYLNNLSSNYQNNLLHNDISNGNILPLSLHKIDHSFKTPKFTIESLYDNNRPRPRILTKDEDIIKYKKDNFHFGKKIFFDKIFRSVIILTQSFEDDESNPAEQNKFNYRDILDKQIQEKKLYKYQILNSHHIHGNNEGIGDTKLTYNPIVNPDNSYFENIRYKRLFNFIKN